MQEQCIAIGETAGVIYQTLEKNGAKTLSVLQKETGVANELLNQAIGWLAREGKISFEKKGNFLQLTLAGSGSCCGQ